MTFQYKGEMVQIHGDSSLRKNLVTPQALKRER